MLKEFEKKMKEKHAYLTEKSLGEVLPLILPRGNWIHNDRFLGYKPDYRNDELKLIVEFDGSDHYQNVIVIMRDLKKGKIYEDAGYKVVRIPYFIQLNTTTIKMFFGIDVELNYEYQHGFVSKTAILPASFCELGVERFLHFMCNLGEFKEIEKEVLDSLEGAVDRLGSAALVLPDSIRAMYLENYRNEVRHHKEIGMFYLEQTLESNWNITMAVLQSLLEAQVGTHDFLPVLDTEEGVITGLKWMYRVLDTITSCELKVQVANINQCILSIRVGSEIFENPISINTTAEKLLDEILGVM